MNPHKYSFIYMDPPWSYNEKVHLKGNVHSSAEHHYPTMGIKDLKKMNIGAIAERDCLILMWVTGPQMDVAIDLINHWNFQFKDVVFCWDKILINPGSYTLTSFEFVLAAKNQFGKIPTPRGRYNIKQGFIEPRGKHSAKPQQIACYIEEMFPHSTKIELFARRKRNGWTCWGNELHKEDHYEPIKKHLFG